MKTVVCILSRKYMSMNKVIGAVIAFLLGCVLGLLIVTHDEIVKHNKHVDVELKFLHEVAKKF